MRFSKEEEYLRQKDKKLKKIIDKNGHISFKSNKKNQFDTLVGIVISQFISTKAANSIFKNIRENFNSEYLNEDIGDLSKLSDQDLNNKLLTIFGIGPWSVNMFEIFCIGKLDIFSSKDAGLRLAMNNFGIIKKDSEWKKYDEYAMKWSPYRSIASIHLWKTVD